MCLGSTIDSVEERCFDSCNYNDDDFFFFKQLYVIIFKGFLAIEKFSHFSLYQPLSLTPPPFHSILHPLLFK